MKAETIIHWIISAFILSPLSFLKYCQQLKFDALLLILTVSKRNSKRKRSKNLFLKRRTSGISQVR